MSLAVLETPEALKEFIGEEIGTSDWVAVTQERIGQFAEATEDRQWIHLDSERAKRDSPYGSTIAHGFLTLSMLSRLMEQAVQIRSGVRLTINYGLNRVRFPSAVREGSRIRGRFSVVNFKELGDAYEAVYACSVECEGSDKPCCVAEWVVRYYK
ncbi:MAG TPA: MaoC family dehydratase [Candidatus Solibacter sp.]|nr:MaoC family dehydratase [Candidatus Solibacter sp.]